MAVSTLGGAESGKAQCYYQLLENPLNFQQAQPYLFVNTGETTHTQSQGCPPDLQTCSPEQGLPQGNYKYDITCNDAAENVAKTNIEFAVASDTEQPRLLHVYKQSSSIFIILNEKTTCKYDSNQFEFGQGNLMTETSSTVHSAPLGLSNYFIKCKDAFNNDLEPTEIIP